MSNAGTLYGSIGVNVTNKTWKHLDLLEAKFKRLTKQLSVIDKESKKAFDFRQTNVKGINTAISSADKLVKKLERIKQLKTTNVKVTSTFLDKDAQKGSKAGSGQSSHQTRDSRQRVAVGMGASGGFWDMLFKGSLIGAGIGGITKYAMFSDKLVSGLTGFTKDTDETVNLISHLDRIATKYGLVITDVGDSFTKFMAGIQTSESIDKQQGLKIYEGFASAGMIYGLSGPEQDRMFKAIIQMISKDQVMGEELKNQLGDVLPGIISKFASENNMEIKDLFKKMERGEVKPEAIKPVAEAYLKSAEGVMKLRQSQIQFNLAQMENSWFKFWNSFFTSDAYDRVVDVLKVVTKILDNPDTAKSFGQVISRAIDKLLLGLNSIDKVMSDFESDNNFEKKVDKMKEILTLVGSAIILLNSGNPFAGILSGLDKAEGKIKTGYIGKLIDLATGTAKVGGSLAITNWLFSKDGESAVEQLFSDKSEPSKAYIPLNRSVLEGLKVGYNPWAERDRMSSSQLSSYNQQTYTNRESLAGQSVSNQYYIDTVQLNENQNPEAFSYTEAGIRVPNFTNGVAQ